MSDEKPWRELSPTERGQRMAAAKKAKQAEREAAAEPDVPPVVEPDAETETEGFDEPEAIAEPVADDMGELRAQLLQGIDPEIAALISDDELMEIKAQEEKRAADEKKKQALADVRAAMKQRARVGHNLIPASQLRSEAEAARLNESVTFRVNLPRGGGAKGFRVDGKLYQNGLVYTESRAVFESLREMHARAHIEEIQFLTLNQPEIQREIGGVANMSAAQILYARNPPPFEVLSN